VFRFDEWVENNNKILSNKLNAIPIEPTIDFPNESANKNQFVNANEPLSHFIRLRNNLWHSKRMKMEKRNGYVIPTVHKNRGFKASERLVESNAVITDISFFKPISIKADLEKIQNFLIQFLVTTKFLFQLFIMGK
jgi:uncharacterized ubiquitin-like protein YukD